MGETERSVPRSNTKHEVKMEIAQEDCDKTGCLMQESNFRPVVSTRIITVEAPFLAECVCTLGGAAESQSITVEAFYLMEVLRESMSLARTGHSLLNLGHTPSLGTGPHS